MKVQVGEVVVPGDIEELAKQNKKVILGNEFYLLHNSYFNWLNLFRTWFKI